MPVNDVVTKYYAVICFNWNGQYIHSTSLQRTRFNNYKQTLIEIHNFSENKESERTCLISKSVSNTEIVTNIYESMKSIMYSISNDIDIGIMIISEYGDQVLNTIENDDLVPINDWTEHVCGNDCYIEYSWRGTYKYANENIKRQFGELKRELELIGFVDVDTVSSNNAFGANDLSDDMILIAKNISSLMNELFEAHKTELKTRIGIELEFPIIRLNGKIIPK